MDSNLITAPSHRLLPVLAAVGTCLVLGAIPFCPFTARAQTIEPGQLVNSAKLSWPRVFSTNGFDFAVYQPQIGSWRGTQLSGRFAVGVRSLATSNQTFGVAFFKARTEIDKVNRLVTLDEFQVTRTSFPTQQSMEPGYLNALRQELPQAARTIPLDHLEAVFVVSQEAAKALTVEVKNATPRIIYCTEPSILVLVDGPPVLKPLTGNYQRVINTRAILLFNTADQTDYLYAGSNWYNASSIDGSWEVDPIPPADISTALEAALATKLVDPLSPEKPLVTPLDVYVSTTPAELIQTSGPESLQLVPGTSLYSVANSDSAIFYNSKDTSYYVLISGRWFKGPYIFGPWTFVPATSLPPDFSKIPPNNPKANALASVPGTPQAREAVIATSIPQTATINRDSAKLSVTYQGPPAFAPISGTPLSYAVNTQTPVVMTGTNAYYACEGGVWFTGESPAGPWTVATSIPRAIYDIPPSCPIHYATYAYVYGSTPDTVSVGYTPGYNGVYLAPDGVAVYGTGYAYPPVVIGDWWVPCPVTYGFGWGMAVNSSTGFAYGFAAGAAFDCWCHPYWGSYGWHGAYGFGYSRVNLNGANYYAHWGPAVRGAGAWGHNAYTGHEWTAQRAAVFNPYTGAYAGNERSRIYYPYGPSSTASRPASPKARAGTWSGNRLYTDERGNVYRPSTSGGWERFSGYGGWHAARPDVSSQANRESTAQNWGDQRFDRYRSSGGGGWGGRIGRFRR